MSTTTVGDDDTIQALDTTMPLGSSIIDASDLLEGTHSSGARGIIVDLEEGIGLSRPEPAQTRVDVTHGARNGMLGSPAEVVGRDAPRSQGQAEIEHSPHQVLDATQHISLLRVAADTSGEHAPCNRGFKDVHVHEVKIVDSKASCCSRTTDSSNDVW